MTSVTPVEQKKPNGFVKFISKVLGRGGENIIFPALGFFAVLIVWSIVAALTADNLSKLPSIEKTIQDSIPYLENFFSTTTGDEGIFFLTLYSLGRVAIGFAIATVIAVPLGFWVGTSKKASKAIMPLVQIGKPISPLAWLPVGIVIFSSFENQDLPAIFVIVVTSLWSTLINTALGVQKIPSDYWNVARVLKMSKLQVVTEIIIPSTLPYIFSGLRLSLGTAWLVIVAAEMLTGGTGIGFFVWDVYNTGDISLVVFSLLVIGVVGLFLDQFVAWVERMLIGQTTAQG
ncbi:MAG: nitrate ABC transporter permease [Cyanobacteria bacterium P01_C01_bin.89]